ncbi:MAG: response regulator, partial [Saprospiraceae bacterium]
MINDPLHRLRTVVLEDEDENREWLLKKLALYPELDVLGSAMTVDEAFLLIARHRPDAAFVDIQLIGGDAFQLLERLRQQGLPIPFMVMTTGYPDYVWTALNDYNRYVVQYLVKPFLENWQEKLRKSIDALLAATAGASADPSPNGLSSIFV